MTAIRRDQNRQRVRRRRRRCTPRGARMLGNAADVCRRLDPAVGLPVEPGLRAQPIAVVLPDRHGEARRGAVGGHHAGRALGDDAVSEARTVAAGSGAPLRRDRRRPVVARARGQRECGRDRRPDPVRGDRSRLTRVGPVETGREGEPGEGGDGEPCQGVRADAVARHVDRGIAAADRDVHGVAVVAREAERCRLRRIDPVDPERDHPALARGDDRLRGHGRWRRAVRRTPTPGWSPRCGIRRPR